MRKSSFFFVYALMVIAQILICNYFHLTSFVMLSILPVLVLCIPIRISTTGSLLIAFVTGFVVDLLAEGVLGLNTLALVPVGLIRIPLIRLVFGEDLISRNEDFSVRKYGFGKVTLAILIVQAVFLIIYILADGAGTRPIEFNAIRFGASLLAGYLLSLILIDTLAPDTRK